MQGFIVENMSGQAALDVLNSNFTELYDSIPVAKKLPGVVANTMVAFDGNTRVNFISLAGISGAPVVRLGTTPNGTELMDDTEIGNDQPVDSQYYFVADGFIYVTISGGTVNIRIDYQPNYY